VYCEDCDIAALVADDSTGPGVRRWAADAQARRLWALSERMTGVRFDPGAA
jgi:hypothetical protein